MKVPPKGSTPDPTSLGVDGAGAKNNAGGPNGADGTPSLAEQTVRETSWTKFTATTTRGQSLRLSDATPPPPGPIAPDSDMGQALLANVRMAMPKQPLSVLMGGTSYDPVRMHQDQLGISHVRLQRKMAGIPIFGEQVAAQIGRDGNITFFGTLHEALETVAPMRNRPAISVESAKRRAYAAVGDAYRMSDGMTTNQPELTYCRTKTADGTTALKLAYHVRMTDFEALHEGQMGPADLSVMVDASNGKILRHWNNIHGPEISPSTVQGVSVNESIDVNQPVGRDPVAVEVQVDADIIVESAKLKLGTPADPGVTHDWRGDVVFNITSPSGRTTQIAPFDPNDSADNVSGDIDLSEAFAGERSQGTWKIEVSDRFPRLDDGIVRRLELELDGPAANPAPTPGPGPNPTPARDDFSDLVGNVQLDTREGSDGFELHTQDGAVETRDARAQNPNGVAGRFGNTAPHVDADDRWGGANATTTTKAAVETHYGATSFVKFLSEQFGLNSLDDGGMKIQAMTNVGRDYNNAFWFNDVIHIGHGDNQIFGRLSSIDIVGHELAHGITEKSANLIYDDQSGGLNESYSDVVGTAFEWWLAKQPGASEQGTLPFDWKVGEDTFTPGTNPDDALRYMDDPLRDGRSLDHFSQYDDSVDVHFSSGIQNNAFYLAVEGGTHRLGGQVEGLKSVFGGDFDRAMDAGAKIWMRALQFYLTPSSGFQSARQATLQSARDLFPENPDVARVIGQSWTAVGVN